MLAWHFVQNNYKLNYVDETIQINHNLLVEPPLQFGKHGLHASKTLLGALPFAKGSLLCRVKLAGEMLEQQNLVCAESRTVLWIQDTKNILENLTIFAVGEALKEIDQYTAENVDLLKAKIQYLENKLELKELENLANQAWNRYYQSVQNKVPIQETTVKLWLARGLMPQAYLGRNKDLVLGNLCYNLLECFSIFQNPEHFRQSLENRFVSYLTKLRLQHLPEVV